MGCENEQKPYKNAELDLLAISQSRMTDLLISLSQFVVFTALEEKSTLFSKICPQTGFVSLRLFSCLHDKDNIRKKLSNQKRRVLTVNFCLCHISAIAAY